MMPHNENPWALRFAPLLDRDTIKQRATVAPPPISGLWKLPAEVACARLQAQLEAVFYVTEQCIRVLQRMAGMAYAHSLVTYPDRQTFMAGIHAKECPLPKFCPAILMTGLGGSGKTTLMQALMRILGIEEKIHLTDDTGYSAFSNIGSWHVSVQATQSPAAILKQLLKQEASPREVHEICRKQAFRDGVMLFLMDELQFATGSTDANTRIAQILLSTCYLGLPFIYAANFSLVNRLLLRPQEERQRLIYDLIVLEPDLPTSEDWEETLRSLKAAAPDILAFDPVRDGPAIHGYTAGIKRLVVKLLVIAFRAEHAHKGSVDLAAIKRAYDSPAFAADREDIGIIASQSIQNRPDKKRKDLWCSISPRTNLASEVAPEIRAGG